MSHEQHSRKQQTEDGAAALPKYVAGRRPVLELLRTDEGRAKIEKVYIAHGVQGQSVSEILHYVHKYKLAHSEIDRRKFGELERTVAKKTDSQGVIVLLNAVTYWELDDLIPEASRQGRVVLVALDGIEDPHNIGAIIRSAEALGANGVLVPVRGTSMTPAVYKTSAGAALNLPIVKYSNLSQTIKDLQEYFGFTCLGLAGEGEQEISQIDTSGNICLVIGSEERGLHQLTRKSCDHLVRIPLKGKTESLNASVAAAIAIYSVISSGK
ncbi:MAG TPA: 23S rRNA (guanosine(2251)-2'-O)-methyltransferase RlmB [Candidatus Kapabacteria bacterium]|nr:23S rRNA (guanosine(2251)-2'-O)-methyltransferase RlmB [Candidatus Kapabacteria bacterium]